MAQKFSTSRIPPRGVRGSRLKVVGFVPRNGLMTDISKRINGKRFSIIKKRIEISTSFSPRDMCIGTGGNMKVAVRVISNVNGMVIRIESVRVHSEREEGKNVRRRDRKINK